MIARQKETIGDRKEIFKGTFRFDPATGNPIALEIEGFDQGNGGRTFYGRYTYHWKTREKTFWEEEVYDPKTNELIFEHGVRLNLATGRPVYFSLPTSGPPPVGAE